MPISKSFPLLLSITSLLAYHHLKSPKQLFILT